MCMLVPKAELVEFFASIQATSDTHIGSTQCTVSWKRKERSYTPLMCGSRAHRQKTWKESTTGDPRFGGGGASGALGRLRGFNLAEMNYQGRCICSRSVRDDEL